MRLVIGAFIIRTWKHLRFSFEGNLGWLGDFFLGRHGEEGKKERSYGKSNEHATRIYRNFTSNSISTVIIAAGEKMKFRSETGTDKLGKKQKPWPPMEFHIQHEVEVVIDKWFPFWEPRRHNRKSVSQTHKSIQVTTTKNLTIIIDVERKRRTHAQ